MLTISSNFNFVSQRYAPPLQGILVEPLLTAYPECGPNAYKLIRKFRKVFDPNGVCAPGRQVYTEKEVKALPEEIITFINDMRKKYNMPPIKRESYT
jgi:hypothetical protein